jgi:hypothetical protein
VTLLRGARDALSRDRDRDRDIVTQLVDLMKRSVVGVYQCLNMNESIARNRV